MHAVKSRYLRLSLLILAAATSLTLAFLLRFDLSVPESERGILVRGLCISLPVKAITFHAFGLHRIRWRFVSLGDLLRLLIANTIGGVAACILILAIIGPPFPRSIYVLDGLLCFLLTAGLSFSVRLYYEAVRPTAMGSGNKTKTVLLYGAGAAGLTLKKEICSNPRLGLKVVGYLDDDRRKQKTGLLGVPVLGTGRDAARLVARFKRQRQPLSEIIIAMPSASGREMRAAVANCRAAGIPFRTIPGLGELLDGKVLSRQIRDVSVNDLLGRAPVLIDESKIAEAISGKNVLVTGGCGSIGSEICRQLARLRPSKLVIFDQAESEMFMLALELRAHYPRLDFATEIGDIVRIERVHESITRHSIDAVFHAAAYKHVPLMEANILEAVENNVIGTLNVAEAAYESGVKQFVLISSDKAVNPTSIMGLTKRIAEIIISAMPLNGGGPGATFVSVRLGNVLASAGSVVKIFQQQIAAGGPVTVTHPEMRRYFMSIPEAVQLILQASTMGHGSEVFVLDMGEPVRVVELARNMIRLAGFVPEHDIDILFTGLRPGEKLFEEIQLEGEDVVPTYHPKIKIFRSVRPGKQYLTSWLTALRETLELRKSEEVKTLLITLVPEYQGTSGVCGLQTEEPTIFSVRANPKRNFPATQPLIEGRSATAGGRI